MFKIIFTLCAILAVARGSFQDEEAKAYRPDDYVNLNRRYFESNLDNYAAQLEDFRHHYDGRVEGVTVFHELVTGSIVQIEDRLNPLEVLSDLDKQCIGQHRHLIPTVVDAERSLQQCVEKANHQIAGLLGEAEKVKTDLETYYGQHFESDVRNCYDNSTNLVSCLSDAVADATKYTISNQKEFETKLEAAECSAKIALKRAIDCNYAVQRNTALHITQADVLIAQCLQCKPCKYHCSNDFKFVKADPFGKTVENPFFEKSSHPDCLLATSQ